MDGFGGLDLPTVRWTQIDAWTLCPALLADRAMSETESWTGRGDSGIQEDFCLDVTKSVYTVFLSQCGRQGIMSIKRTEEDCTGLEAIATGLSRKMEED